jgi:hypothetical protein
LLINTPQRMDQYINGVMLRARHHGGNVTDAVILLKTMLNEYGINLQISDRANGKTGNVSWFQSKATGRQYYLRYEHANHSIEMRHNNCNGRVVAYFNNSSTASDFVSVFENI